MRTRNNSMGRTGFTPPAFNATILTSLCFLLSACLGLHGGTSACANTCVRSAERTRQSPTPEAQLQPGEVLDKFISLIKENPNDEAAWTTLKRMGKTAGFIVWDFNVPVKSGIDPVSRTVILSRDIMGPQSNEAVGAAWMMYGMTKALWAAGEYQKRHHDAKEYKPSFEEEYQAFENLLEFWGRAKQKSPALSDDKLDILARIHKDDLLDAYIYLQMYRPESEASFKQWRREKPEKLDAYFKKYVLIPEASAPDYVLKDVSKDESARQAEASKSGEASFTAAPEDNPEEMEQRKKKNDERFELLKKADALTDPRERQAAQAALYNEIGINFRHLKDYRNSLAYHDKALRLYQALGEPLGTALAYTLMGNTYRSMGDYPNAISAKKQSVVWCQKSKDDRGLLVLTLSDLGPLSSRVEEFTDAVGSLRQAYSLAKERGDAKLLDKVMNDFANTYSNAFKSISWHLNTGLGRESSPADFVNNGDVGDASDKYGRKSPDEDAATFVTLAVSQNFARDGREAGRLTKHVRAEMLKGNFAPAAKYLYAKYIFPTYYGSAMIKPLRLLLEGDRRNQRLPDISPLLTIEVLRGNLQPMLDHMRSTNLYTEEEIEAVKKSFSPVANDITFEEVSAELKRAQARGRFIPANVLQVVRLFEEAHTFAQTQNINGR